MKKVMTLAAAGMIALSAPAFAGSYSEPVVAAPVTVVEDAGSSISSGLLVLMGLAVVAAAVASNKD